MHYHGTPGAVKPCWCNQPNKGEPYRQVKIRAGLMLSGVITLPTALTILDRLIESAPQQTLDALCEVIDPD